MWLTRFVLYALLFFLVYRALARFVRGMMLGMGVAPRKKASIDESVRMVRDPVCGTFVIPASALAVRDGEGTHHFCSGKCRDAYLAKSQR